MPKDKSFDSWCKKTNNVLIRFEDEHLDAIRAGGLDSKDTSLNERVRDWLKDTMEVKIEKQRKKEQREESQRLKMELRRKREETTKLAEEDDGDEEIDLT